MSQATTQILLPRTSYTGANSVIGTPVPAASYYLSSQNLQTLTWNLVLFLGIINVQATLVDSPTEDDWFTVYSIDSVTIPVALTQVSYYNIQGNFVWMRAKIENFTAGDILNVKVSY
jgi:hypothetical protein